MTITVGNLTFKSQKALKTFMKEFLHHSLPMGSLRETPAYDFMTHFVKRHPDITDVEDIIIQHNKLRPQYKEINVLLADGTIKSLSYKTCVSGKPKSDKIMYDNALRNCISDQIIEYITSNSMVCALCESVDDVEVDHSIQFCDMRDEFTRLYYEGELPTEYDFDEYNRPLFKDKEFANLFKRYHKEHAVLRPLCKRCNSAENVRVNIEKF